MYSIFSLLFSTTNVIGILVKNLLYQLFGVQPKSFMLVRDDTHNSCNDNCKFGAPSGGQL